MDAIALVKHQNAMSSEVSRHQIIISTFQVDTLSVEARNRPEANFEYC